MYVFQILNFFSSRFSLKRGIASPAHVWAMGVGNSRGELFIDCEIYTAFKQEKLLNFFSRSRINPRIRCASQYDYFCHKNRSSPLSVHLKISGVLLEQTLSAVTINVKISPRLSWTSLPSISAILPPAQFSSLVRVKGARWDDQQPETSSQLMKSS